jgi:hypothetical protein
MKKNSKGNLLLTFIILIALTMTIFSFLSITGVRVKESGVKVTEYDSFYIAEAGLNKAMWYLGTPVIEGGKGFYWRATNFYEAYGWGGYYLTVLDTEVSGEVLIIATGEAGGSTKNISQVVEIGGLPQVFDYAVFNNAGINMSGNAEIDGSIFINGNTHFSGSATVTDGSVYHPLGTTITGGGTYTDGGEPTPVPTFPSFDTSYYSGLISAAGGVSAGDLEYKNTTVNLDGATIYVNGDIKVSGTTTFNGPGIVVATGNIEMSGSTYSTESVKFISNGVISMSGNSYTSGATFYSASSIAASGTYRINTGCMLTYGNLDISGNVNVSGMLFAVGQISLSGNPVISGSMVSGALQGVTGLSGNTRITYDESMLPEQLPPGFSPTSVTRVKGTWKEN